jgi:peptidyl-prolyl cis-trans isomerase B (cyclophilin B)
MGTRIVRWGIAGLVVCAGVIGCGGGKPGDQPAPTVSLPAGPATSAELAASAAVKVSSFAEAVTENSPDDQQPPPDRTLNGHSSGKLRVEVQRQWEQVQFTAPSGKKLSYRAVLNTDMGTVAIALRPEVAPNHVRNFVALARARYYDGLLFEQVLQQEGDSPDVKLELVEAGCPLGTGEPGIGHLGYWLRPEFNAEVKHEEGTVGACLTGGPDTGACRFYITLSKAPVMDGNFTVFGKVTQGLDVVRTIARQPRPDGSLRPHKPAVIQKVTVETREVD